MSLPPATRFRCVALRRSGATEIRIVHAADEAATRARLIAAGLDPVSVEAIGPSLFDTLAAKLRARGRIAAPAWRPRLALPVPDVPRRAWRIATLALVSIPVSVAILSWGLVLVADLQAGRIATREAGAIARARTQMLGEAARAVVAPAMTAAPVEAIVGRLAAILPADSGLASVARDQAGALAIEIDTPDPDRIRPLLATDPIFGVLRETGQAPTDEGTIRVTLEGGAR
jgi:hypothetical protein